MFIDGNPSKQPQNSVSLRPADVNKPRLSSKINSLNEPNSTKTSSRKKSRKSIKSTTDDENKASHYSTLVDQVNPTTTTTHSIVDITNQSLEDQNTSTESHLNTIELDSTNTTVSIGWILRIEISFYNFIEW